MANVIISESDESRVIDGSEFPFPSNIPFKGTLGTIQADSIRYFEHNSCILSVVVRIIPNNKTKQVKIKIRPAIGGNARTIIGEMSEPIKTCEPYSLMEMVDIVDKTMGNDDKYSLKSMSEMIEIRIKRVIDALNEKCSQSEIQELIVDYYKYMNLNRLLVEFIDVFSQRTSNKLSKKVMSSYDALVKAYKQVFELTLVCKREKKASSDVKNPLKELYKGFEDKGWVVK